jgi:hypothetical protein
MKECLRGSLARRIDVNWPIRIQVETRSRCSRRAEASVIGVEAGAKREPCWSPEGGGRNQRPCSRSRPAGHCARLGALMESKNESVAEALLDRGYGRPCKGWNSVRKQVPVTKVQVVFVKPGERMTTAPCQNTVPLQSLT